MSKPSCELCGNATSLSLHPKCHGNAPLHATLEGDELVLRCYVPTCFREVARHNVVHAAEIAKLQSQLTQARERLADVVIVDGASSGVFKLHALMQRYVTEDGEVRKRISPAGKALLELYEGLK